MRSDYFKYFLHWLYVFYRQLITEVLASEKSRHQYLTPFSPSQLLQTWHRDLSAQVFSSDAFKNFNASVRVIVVY